METVYVLKGTEGLRYGAKKEKSRPHSKETFT